MAQSEDLNLKNVELRDRNYFMQVNKDSYPVEFTFSKNAVQKQPVQKVTHLKHT